MSINHLLNVTVAIQRNKPVSDGQGGHTTTFATQSTVKTRRFSVSGRDVTIADQERGRVTDKFYFNPGVDVRPQDQLVIGLQKWQVLVVKAPSEAEFFTVLTEETQSGG